MKKISKIVITGGPCSGKTTIIKQLRNQYSNLGYKVVTLSETATDLIISGIIGKDPKIGAMPFQQAIMRTQINKEKIYEELLKHCEYENIIMFCDRGLMDGKAYVSNSDFEKLLKEFKLTEQDVLNKYDSVIHLESVAKAKPELFGYDTNQARTSTVEQAIIFNDKVYDAWHKHKNFVPIPFEEDFHKKLKKTSFAIDRMVNTDIERSNI